MTEDRFRTTIVMPRLRSRGAVVTVMPKTVMAPAGVSDLLVCYRGRFIALELKSPDPKSRYDATPLQLDYQTRVRQSGGYAIVTSSWDDIEALLRIVDEEV